MRETLKEKDSLISSLETAKESLDKELAYLCATNADLADQNQVSQRLFCFPVSNTLPFKLWTKCCY